MAGGSFRFRMPSVSLQSPGIVQAMPDGGPVTMRVGGAQAGGPPPVQWVSPSAVAAGHAPSAVAGGSGPAPLLNDRTRPIVADMAHGKSPLAQVDPEQLHEALRFCDKAYRNVRAWMQTPEYSYLAQIGTEAHLSLESLVMLPREILNMSAPISWQPTEEDRSKARQDLLSFTNTFSAAAAPLAFVGGGGRGGGGRGGGGRGGRGGRGGGKVVAVGGVGAGTLGNSLTQGQALNLSTLTPDEQIMRVNFYNKHANLTAVLDALANPMLNGGTNLIKSFLLRGAENSALMRLPPHLHGATVEDFYHDPGARREMAMLVALSYRHASAASGTGHLNRVLDDQAAGLREKTMSMKLHCYWAMLPFRHVAYDPDISYAPHRTLRSVQLYDPYAGYSPTLASVSARPSRRTIDLL